MHHRMYQAFGIRGMRIVAFTARQTFRRQSHMVFEKAGGIAGMASETGVGNRGHEKLGVIGGMRLMAIETPIGAGNRHMVGLGGQLPAQVGMAIDTECGHRCSKKGLGSAGVWLVTVRAAGLLWRVSRAESRCDGRDIVTGDADFGGTGYE